MSAPEKRAMALAYANYRQEVQEKIKAAAPRAGFCRVWRRTMNKT
jgi:hypothetical protein